MHRATCVISAVPCKYYSCPQPQVLDSSTRTSPAGPESRHASCITGGAIMLCSGFVSSSPRQRLAYEHCGSRTAPFPNLGPEGSKLSRVFPIHSPFTRDPRREPQPGFAHPIKARSIQPRSASRLAFRVHRTLIQQSLMQYKARRARGNHKRRHGLVPYCYIPNNVVSESRFSRSHRQCALGSI